MKKKLLIFFILIFLGMVLVYGYLHMDRGRRLDKSHTVYIEKSEGDIQIYRNGKPFYIKGASGKTHLKELSEAGGNTLRVYDTLNLQPLLDEAKQYDLAVIVDIPLPRYFKNSTYYTDKENIEKVKYSVRKLIQQHKNHPSLLIWNLGNELNYPLTIKNNDFINVFNDLVDIIHQEDPNHLVSTSISGTSRGQTLGIHLNSPKLDLVGFNTFNELSKVKSLMDNVSILMDPMPYYVMEWGNGGPWEAPINLWKSIIEPTSTAKAARYEEAYLSSIITDKNCLGSLAFYWGYKHEGTPTWFNIFDEEGRKSEVFYQLKSLWNENQLYDSQNPKIEKMLLNYLESNDQIFVSTDSIDVQVEIQKNKPSQFSYHWKIYKEGWGYQDWEMETDSSNVTYDYSTPLNRMKFQAPNEEGPYRIVVSVQDLKGNFATANMPFYVLNK